jgi:hypothetical protein
MAIALLTRASCRWCGPGTRARWYVPVRGYNGEETDRLGVCDAHLGEVLACGYQVKELDP